MGHPPRARGKSGRRDEEAQFRSVSSPLAGSKERQTKDSYEIAPGCTTSYVNSAIPKYPIGALRSMYDTITKMPTQPLEPVVPQTFAPKRATDVVAGANGAITKMPTRPLEPPQVKAAREKAGVTQFKRISPGNPSRSELFYGPIVPAVTAEETISLLNTISVYAVQLRQGPGLQDIFINDVVDDITRRDTIRIPAVTGQRSQEDERRVIASTAGGAAIAGVGDFLSALLRYTTNVVMTHLVAVSTYGIFVEANTVATVAGYASKLGLDSATLRFLSMYRAKGERGLVSGLIRFASMLALISGVIWAALFFFLSSVLARAVYHTEVYALPFKEISLLIPMIGMQLVLASGLQALKAIKWKVYVDRLIQPGLTLVMLLVFYLLGLRLEALILGTACGFLASNITGRILLGKAKKKLVRDAEPQYRPKLWMRFAFPMFFNSMIRNVLNATDVLFLGVFATTSQVGLYGAADRVSYFVVAPLIALNVIFSPLIADYHARGEHKQLASTFKLVTKWSFSLSWPVFLCCLVFRDAILGVFGEKYVVAGAALIILALGNLVDSGVGSVNYLLVMTGRPRVILMNTVTTVVVNLALALLLVPRFTIVGAAVAAALTVIILNIVALIEVYWIMKIHPFRRDSLKPVVAGAVAALTGFALTQVIHVGYGHLAILGVLGLMLAFALVYVAALKLFGFSEEDLIVWDIVRSKLGGKKAA